MTEKPTVKIDLSGPDANVYVIIGRVSQALINAGLHDQSREFRRLAVSQQSYKEVLNICRVYVEFEA